MSQFAYSPLETISTEVRGDGQAVQPLPHPHDPEDPGAVARLQSIAG